MKPIKRGEKSKVIMTGKYSYANGQFIIRSWDEGAHIFIGSFCSIADNITVFLGGNHRTDWVTTFPFGHVFKDRFPAGDINGSGHPTTKGHVVIENDVWIGSSCTIMSGVTVGSGSVIAAESVVINDVEPYSIVAGNPAKLIKKRFSEKIIERFLKMSWWDYSEEIINKIVPLLQSIPDEEVLSKIENILNHS